MPSESLQSRSDSAGSLRRGAVPPTRSHSFKLVGGVSRSRVSPPHWTLYRTPWVRRDPTPGGWSTGLTRRVLTGSLADAPPGAENKKMLHRFVYLLRT
jgi:hypothetical protein